jgi:hypothetical protein
LHVTYRDAIQKTRHFPHRVKVLGRALLAARTEPNLFWMLLSGNAEISFASTTTSLLSVPLLQMLPFFLLLLLVPLLRHAVSFSRDLSNHMRESLSTIPTKNVG